MLESASRGVVSPPGKWCLLQGSGVCSGVVSALGGLVSAPEGGVGVWSGGRVSGPGGYIPACTEADPLLPVDRQTPVKILPWPNFVAAGKNEERKRTPIL